MTWRPLAPSARSSAISRSRWATTIENVLKMMNVPTNRAISAKTSSATLKNWRAFLMSLWFSLVICAPVSTWYVLLSSVAAIRFFSVSCETPGCATTEIESNWPVAPVIACAVGVSNSAADAPAALSASPNLAIPTIWYFAGGPCVRIVTWSPTLKPALLADPASITT